ISSPQPINQVVPNQPLVTENVRESALGARLDILRDQTDKPLDAGHAQSLARDDIGPGPRDDDRGERGENDSRNDDQHVGPNVEGSARPFGELPFAPVWGITDCDRMVKFRHCRDMMSNIFTPADLASFEERKLGRLRLTRIEQLRSDRERFAVAAGHSEAIRKRLITEFFPTFVQRLLQSKEYKVSVGEVFSLAVGKGFINGISLGRTQADVDALLNARRGRLA
ncbi:hypothetical protein Tco_0036231, partial [Tanacetum coccineum]